MPVPDSASLPPSSPISSNIPARNSFDQDPNGARCRRSRPPSQSLNQNNNDYNNENGSTTTTTVKASRESVCSDASTRPSWPANNPTDNSRNNLRSGYSNKGYMRSSCNSSNRRNRSSRSRSSSPWRNTRINRCIDSDEEYRRSRSRERKRRRTQAETIRRYNSGKGETSQVIWDGFQWVKKSGDSMQTYDQEMNSTRRARRLHIGNLPLSKEVKEDDLRSHLWAAMLSNNLCESPLDCPILHVWFARDRGGTFGFIEMKSVDMAIKCLKLDGLGWKGNSIRINRPSDWKNNYAAGGGGVVDEETISKVVGSSGAAKAESLAAAAQQAAATGNTGGLMKLVSDLPAEQQKAIAKVINSQSAAAINMDKQSDLLKERIKTDLLSGPPSRVVQICSPASSYEGDEDILECMGDMRTECEKHGCIVSLLTITKENKENMPRGELGDIFFEFARITQADNCVINMAGRMYDNRPLKVIRFDEAVWKHSLKKLSENLLLKKLDIDQ